MSGAAQILTVAIPVGLGIFGLFYVMKKPGQGAPGGNTKTTSTATNTKTKTKSKTPPLNAKGKVPVVLGKDDARRKQMNNHGCPFGVPVRVLRTQLSGNYDDNAGRWVKAAKFTDVCVVADEAPHAGAIGGITKTKGSAWDTWTTTVDGTNVQAWAKQMKKQLGAWEMMDKDRRQQPNAASSGKPGYMLDPRVCTEPDKEGWVTCSTAKFFAPSTDPSSNNGLAPIFEGAALTWKPKMSLEYIGHSPKRMYIYEAMPGVRRQYGESNTLEKCDVHNGWTKKYSMCDKNADGKHCYPHKNKCTHWMDREWLNAYNIDGNSLQGIRTAKVDMRVARDSTGRLVYTSPI